jgi:hypothetical protein
MIVVSAIGADPAIRVLYNRVKGETELALVALNLRSLVIVRPSLLSGERGSTKCDCQHERGCSENARTLRMYRRSQRRWVNPASLAGDFNNCTRADANRD